LPVHLFWFGNIQEFQDGRSDVAEPAATAEWPALIIIGHEGEGAKRDTSHLI
jgi:hypothetical protein